MAIQRINLPDGTTVRPDDWVTTEPLYSTVEINQGPISTLNAFSYGVGGEVPGSPGPRAASWADTNLQGTGGKLPENEDLRIFSIQIQPWFAGDGGVLPTNERLAVGLNDGGLLDAPTVARLQRDLLIALPIAGLKNYIRQPLGFFPESGGTLHPPFLNPALYDGQSPNPGQILVGYNGKPTTTNKRVLASPITIAAGEAFSVDVECPTGQVRGLRFNNPNDRIRLRISLDSQRRRPVA